MLPLTRTFPGHHRFRRCQQKLEGSWYLHIPLSRISFLMHYLDYVFTLQFRHQKYAANFSSGSWLFSLIKRIIPLRHSVLSLSALHQYHLHQHGRLGRPHDGTLSEIRQFIRDQTSDSLADNHVPILACCVQLISFDVRNTLFRSYLVWWSANYVNSSFKVVTRSGICICKLPIH
jgi:hypothetical protein